MKENETVLYLCNGYIPDCKRSECYLNGGECHHTSNIEYAKGFDKVYGRSGDAQYWQNNHWVNNQQP